MGIPDGAAHANRWQPCKELETDLDGETSTCPARRRTLGTDDRAKCVLVFDGNAIERDRARG